MLKNELLSFLGWKPNSILLNKWNLHCPVAFHPPNGVEVEARKAARKIALRMSNTSR